MSKFLQHVMRPIRPAEASIFTSALVQTLTLPLEPSLTREQLQAEPLVSTDPTQPDPTGEWAHPSARGRCQGPVSRFRLHLFEVPTPNIDSAIGPWAAQRTETPPPPPLSLFCCTGFICLNTSECRKKSYRVGREGRKEGRRGKVFSLVCFLFVLKASQISSFKSNRYMRQERQKKRISYTHSLTQARIHSVPKRKRKLSS